MRHSPEDSPSLPSACVLAKTAGEGLRLLLRRGCDISLSLSEKFGFFFRKICLIKPRLKVANTPENSSAGPREEMLVLSYTFSSPNWYDILLAVELRSENDRRCSVLTL